MPGLPGIPTTAATRPPPTAGPRLRNFMFSSGSLLLLLFGDLASSAFLSLSCAVSEAVAKQAKTTRTDISLNSVFIKQLPEKANIQPRILPQIEIGRASCRERV